MVVETRYRSGRGTRKGRGVDNHQRVFRDHIKHMNEVRMFEKSLTGNQKVKIKQEKVENTVGNKYIEIDGTQEDETSDKERTASSSTIGCLDNTQLKGTDNQKISIMDDIDTSLSDVGESEPTRQTCMENLPETKQDSNEKTNQDTGATTEIKENNARNEVNFQPTKSGEDPPSAVYESHIHKKNLADSTEESVRQTKGTDFQYSDPNEEEDNLNLKQNTTAYNLSSSSLPLTSVRTEKKRTGISISTKQKANDSKVAKRRKKFFQDIRLYTDRLTKLQVRDEQKQSKESTSAAVEKPQAENHTTREQQFPEFLESYRTEKNESSSTTMKVISDIDASTSDDKSIQLQESDMTDSSIEDVNEITEKLHKLKGTDPNPRNDATTIDKPGELQNDLLSQTKPISNKKDTNNNDDSSQNTNDSSMDTDSSVESSEESVTDDDIETLYDDSTSETVYEHKKKVSWSLPPMVQEIDMVETQKNIEPSNGKKASMHPTNSSYPTGHPYIDGTDIVSNRNEPSPSKNNYRDTRTEVVSEKSAHKNTENTSHLQVGDRIIRRIPQKFTLIAKSKENVRNTIQQRGYEMMEDIRVWESPIKLEFNLEKTVTAYNVRENVIEILEKMKLVDNSVKVKSTIKKNVEWITFDSLPEDEAFNDHFQVKEIAFRSHRKILVHLHLMTQIPITRIKYTKAVKEHLFQKNIWLKMDRFNAKVESTPGHLVMIHPHLVNRDSLTEELMSALTQAKINSDLANEIVNDDSSGLRNKDDSKKQLVPYFYLEPSLKKWGNIKVETLRINCAKEKSELLKFLFSSASEQGLLSRGEFLPVGLQLMEGKEIVSNILQAHSDYVKTVKGIPLQGIALTDMIAKNKENKSISEMLLEIDGIESIEKSRDTDYNGHWTMVVQASKELSVMNQLKTNLGDLYSNQIGQTKIIRVGKTNVVNHGSKNSVMTYAEILSRKYATASSLTAAPSSLRHAENNSTEDKKIVSAAKHGTDHHKSTPQTFDSILSKKNQSTALRSEETELHRKIAQMETTQTKLLAAQTKLQQDNERTKKELQQKQLQENESSRQEYMEELIDKKLNSFREAQEKHVEDVKTSLTNDIHTALGTKIELISQSVANQVASQIITAFKQYIATPTINGGDTIEMDSPTRLLTQDTYVSPNQKQLKRIEESGSTNFYAGDDSIMTDYITPNDKTYNSPNENNSSPHDNKQKSLHIENE